MSSISSTTAKVVTLFLLFHLNLIEIQSFSFSHLYNKAKGYHSSFPASSSCFSLAPQSLSSLSRMKMTTLKGIHNENDSPISSSSSSSPSPSPSPPLSEALYPNLRIIGICGSIGSGKSYTSSLLVSKLNSIYKAKSLNEDELNNNNNNSNSSNNNNNSNNNSNNNNNGIAHHIDTDSLAHGVYKPGSLALQEIEQVFGQDVIQSDGTVNRKALGEIVFSDEKEMAVSLNVPMILINNVQINIFSIEITNV
jgi:hypothetical protein